MIGEQKRKNICTKKETGNVVESKFCAGLPKPPSETKVCNEYCFLRLEFYFQSIKP